MKTKRVRPISKLKHLRNPNAIPELRKEHQNKLHPEDYQEKIANALRQGNYLETAATYSGVSKPLLYEWLKKGRKATDKNDPYKKFIDAIDEAMVYAEMRDLQRLDKHGENDWKVIAWKMTRRYPKRWGDKIDVNLNGSIETTSNVKIDEAKLALELKKLESNDDDI